MPRIIFCCQIRHWSHGIESIEVEARTVRDALRELAKRVPTLPEGFLTRDGRLCSTWTVAIGERCVGDDEVDTFELAEDAEIQPVPKPQWLDREGVRTLYRRGV